MKRLATAVEKIVVDLRPGWDQARTSLFRRLIFYNDKSTFFHNYQTTRRSQ